MHPLIRSQGTGINVTTYRVVSYIFVAAMIGCAAYTAVTLVTHIRPSWQPWYVVGICLLVAIDRLYTYRRFRDWMVLTREWILRFGSELVVIIVLTRLVVGLSHGWQALLAEIPLWRNDFLPYFFSPEFMVVLFLVLAAWVLSSNFAALLDDIGLDEELSIAEASASQKKRSARERLMSLFFSLGAVLVIFTALTRVELRASLIVDRPDIAFQDLPALAAGGASTLLYFMFGLALLSQTQFITLHVRWDMRRIPISVRLAGRWAIYSLVFLLLIALIVTLLPTSYSLGPLQVLNYVLNVIVYVFLLIGKVIVDFILAVLDFFYAPFKPKTLLGTPTPQAQPTQVQTLPPPPVVHGATPLWWEVLQSLLFWSVFLGILVFAVNQYMRQHRDALTTLRKIPGWHLLEQFWAWLGWLLASTGESVSQVVRVARERLRVRQAAARDLLERGFLNLRSLDSRQRVAFFYLALVRRGGESGLPRRNSETPTEYAVTLQAALPDVDQDIASLTEAFIEARYSPKPVLPEKASLVRATWERVRKALRAVTVNK